MFFSETVAGDIEKRIHWNTRSIVRACTMLRACIE